MRSACGRSSSDSIALVTAATPIASMHSARAQPPGGTPGMRSQRRTHGTLRKNWIV